MTQVLIIEDEHDIRDALTEVLQFEGYAVTSASNGAEGLAEARLHHPDVILLDLMMPVMNGWQFRDEQKRDAAIRDVPVVVISALRNQELDAAAFIPKPCSVDDVLGAVVRFGVGRA